MPHRYIALPALETALNVTTGSHHFLWTAKAAENALCTNQRLPRGAADPPGRRSPSLGCPPRSLQSASAGSSWCGGTLLGPEPAAVSHKEHKGHRYMRIVAPGWAVKAGPPARHLESPAKYLHRGLSSLFSQTVSQ